MTVRHGVLTANTVASVSLGIDASQVEILKRDSEGEIFVSIDGADPVIGGDDFHCIPEGLGALVLPALQGGTTTVKLISDTAVRFSVRSV